MRRPPPSPVVPGGALKNGICATSCPDCAMPHGSNDSASVAIHSLHLFAEFTSAVADHRVCTAPECLPKKQRSTADRGSAQGMLRSGEVAGGSGGSPKHRRRRAAPTAPPGAGAVWSRCSRLHARSGRWSIRGGRDGARPGARRPHRTDRQGLGPMRAGRSRRPPTPTVSARRNCPSTDPWP